MRYSGEGACGHAPCYVARSCGHWLAPHRLLVTCLSVTRSVAVCALVLGWMMACVLYVYVLFRLDCCVLLCGMMYCKIRMQTKDFTLIFALPGRMSENFPHNMSPAGTLARRKTRLLPFCSACTHAPRNHLHPPQCAHVTARIHVRNHPTGSHRVSVSRCADHRMPAERAVTTVIHDAARVLSVFHEWDVFISVYHGMLREYLCGGRFLGAGE